MDWPKVGHEHRESKVRIAKHSLAEVKNMVGHLCGAERIALGEWMGSQRPISVADIAAWEPGATDHHLAEAAKLVLNMIRSLRARNGLLDAMTDWIAERRKATRVCLARTASRATILRPRPACIEPPEGDL